MQSSPSYQAVSGLRVIQRIAINHRRLTACQPAEPQAAVAPVSRPGRLAPVRLDAWSVSSYTFPNRRPRRPAAFRRLAGFLINPMQRLLSTFLIAGIGLGACSAALPTSTPGREARPGPTASRPLATSPPAPPPQPSATAVIGTLAAPSPSETCPEGRGHLIREEVESSRLVRPLPFLLYLPPCFDATRTHGYPAIILLHGLTGHPDQWLEMGLVEAADELISSGRSGPFLIAMPWMRTGIEHEPALIEVLLPALEASYSARPGSPWLAIGGVSRGAGWSLRIGFKHSDQFGAIGLHSPAVLAGDLTSLGVWSQSITGARLPRIWIDIGERDSLLDSAEALSSRLDELGIRHHYQVGPGDHSPAYWSSNLADYLAWYTEPW